MAMTNQFYSYNQRPMMTSSSNLDWIMVPSVQQVENVAVQPMQKAWVMVQNEPIFALRTADQMGLVTTDYYKFEKWTPMQQPVQEYVTREQMERAIAEALHQKGETA